ncbi:MAG: hypothetical protein KF685_03595 [Acidobacteria bacterium]|nr:hypothetical protein [Acidobacteriota bacterium]
MRQLVLTTFLLLFLIGCGQPANDLISETSGIDIRSDEIEFVTIKSINRVQGAFDETDTREIQKLQFELIAKTLGSGTSIGVCKFAPEFVIKVYLNSDEVRTFRANSKTVKYDADTCFDISDDSFFNDLWNNSREIEIDTSKIALLPLNDLNYVMFKSKEAASLSIDELKEIEAFLQHGLNKKVEVFLQNRTNREGLKDLGIYYRQYAAVLNDIGEKEVWANFLCNKFDHKDWTKERIDVADGGNCFFNLHLNLATGKITGLYINGEA